MGAIAFNSPVLRTGPVRPSGSLQKLGGGCAARRAGARRTEQAAAPGGHPSSGNTSNTLCVVRVYCHLLSFLGSLNRVTFFAQKNDFDQLPVSLGIYGVYVFLASRVKKNKNGPQTSGTLGDCPLFQRVEKSGL